MYHGATKENAAKIILSGYINAGCFCADRKRAGIYATSTGVIFTFKKSILILEYMRHILIKVLYILFGKMEPITMWMMDHGMVPVDFEEYVNNIFTHESRKIKWDCAENNYADPE